MTDTKDWRFWHRLILDPDSAKTIADQFRDLEKAISDLQSELSTLQTRIANLESRISKLQTAKPKSKPKTKSES